MMNEPWFWRERSFTARAIAAGLAPLSFLYDAAQQARWRLTTPASPDIPTICIGNATLGGVGKTPFAIALMELLKAEEYNAHFLTRGYGGSLNGPVALNDRHGAAEAGDEALLLGRRAPVWISKDRPAGIAKAAAAGADAVIMDDGYQNPSVDKTFSILLIDGADPQGNGRIFPAGPLREPLARARSRADIVVIIGATEAKALSAAEAAGAPFAAWLTPVNSPPPQRVVAFCGIGGPARFFSSLKAAGFDVARETAFPDHHAFSAADFASLQKLAASQNAALITTEKDFVRLQDHMQKETLVFPVAMQINQPSLLVSSIRTAIENARNPANRPS